MYIDKNHVHKLVIPDFPFLSPTIIITCLYYKIIKKFTSQIGTFLFFTGSDSLLPSYSSTAEVYGLDNEINQSFH